MRVINLEEGYRDSAIAYHFTNIENLIEILNSDTMKATNPPDEITKNKPSWSVTRQGKGMAFRNISNIDEVRLTIDLGVISNKQTIVPFSHTVFAKNSRKFEFEERIIGDTPNISKAIIDIQFHTFINPEEKVLKLSKTADSTFKVLYDLKNPNDSFNDQPFEKMMSSKEEVIRNQNKDLEILTKGSKDELEKYFSELYRTDDHFVSNVRLTLSGYWMKESLKRFRTYYEHCSSKLKELQKITKVSDKSFSKVEDGDTYKKRDNTIELLKKIKNKKPKVVDLKTFEEYLKSKSITLSFGHNFNFSLGSVTKSKATTEIKKFKQEVNDMIKDIERCKEIYDKYKSVNADNILSGDREDIVVEALQNAVNKSVVSQIKDVLNRLNISSKELTLLYSKGKEGKLITFAIGNPDEVIPVCKNQLKNKTWKIGSDLQALKKFDRDNLFLTILIMHWNRLASNTESRLNGKKFSDFLVNYITDYLIRTPQYCFISIATKQNVHTLYISSRKEKIGFTEVVLPNYFLR